MMAPACHPLPFHAMYQCRMQSLKKSKRQNMLCNAIKGKEDVKKGRGCEEVGGQAFGTDHTTAIHSVTVTREGKGAAAILGKETIIGNWQCLSLMRSASAVYVS